MRDALSERKKTPKVFIFLIIYIVGGESQIRKGDKRMKVLGLFVFLMFVGSILAV